ncbi:MAG: hypothetical protein ACE3L7_32715 [Candidatus Pristimantibacillus sp.]
MSREEVISAFPVTIDFDIGFYAYLLPLAVILIIGSGIFHIEKKNRLSLGVNIGSEIIGIIIIISFATAFAPQLSSMNGEKRDQWYAEIFTPYIENLEQKKVSIIDKMWTEEARLSVILDVTAKRKIYSGYTDFSFYEPSDPEDLGYAVIRDLGDLNDFPEEAFYLLRSHNRIEILELYLPKKNNQKD